MTRTRLFPASDPALYLALALFCIAISNSWWSARSSVGVDYYQYWVAGQAVARHDVRSIYSQSDRRILRDQFLAQATSSSAGRSTRQLLAAQGHPELELFSTPLMYSLFAATTTGDYEQDYWRFRLLCLVVTLASLPTLCHMFGLSPTATLIVTSLLTWLSPPYMSDVRVGNVNQLLLGLLTLFLWSTRHPHRYWRDLFGGFVLGFAVMFKPTISMAAVLLILVWLIDREYRAVLLHALGLFAAVLVALVVSRHYFGSLECWTDWLTLLTTLDSWRISVSLGNESLSRLVLEWTGRDISAVLLLCLLGVTLTLAWLGRGRDSGTLDPRLARSSMAVGVGCVITLLASKLAWLHYFVLAAPLLLYLYRQDNDGGTHDLATDLRRLAVLAAIVLYSVQPVFLLIGPNGTQVHIAAIISAGTATLLTAAWIDLSGRGRGRREDLEPR
jgi:hypothetical protein